MKRLRSLWLVGVLLGCARQSEPCRLPPQTLDFRPTTVVPASGPSIGRRPGPPDSRHSHGRLRGTEEQLELYGLRAKDGATLTADELLDQLSGAEAVCIGEMSQSALSRESELTVLEALHERAGASGRQLGVGLSMFALDQQRFLDDFSAGKVGLHHIDDASYRPHPGEGLPRFYAPLLAAARDCGSALVALNVRSDLALEIEKEGVFGLSRDDKSQLRKLHLTREQLLTAQAQDGNTDDPPQDPSAARSAELRLVSEATMASTAASWLAERRPLRQLLIVADVNTCQSQALPRRLSGRLVDATIVNAVPVLAGEGELPELVDGYDYALVLSPEPTAGGGP